MRITYLLTTAFIDILYAFLAGIFNPGKPPYMIIAAWAVNRQVHARSAIFRAKRYRHSDQRMTIRL